MQDAGDLIVSGALINCEKPKLATLSVISLLENVIEGWESNAENQ